MSIISNLIRTSATLTEPKFSPIVTSVRNKWADWRMKKDVRKRITLAEHAVDKLRVNAMRKNTILPIELRELADKQINEFPRDAVGKRIQGRCAFTSRPRGNVLRWRLSRIVWRDLADHNQICGIQRAMW